MSNLLSSLIARTTETAVSAADILQPRPRALFETETQTAVPSLPIENLETAESTPQPIQPPAPAEPRRPAPEMKLAPVQPPPKPVRQKQSATESTPASRPPAPPPLTASQSPPKLPAVAAPEPAPTPDRLPLMQTAVVKTSLVREQPVIRPQIQRIVAPETAVPHVKERPTTSPQEKPTQLTRLDSLPVPSLPKKEGPAAKATPAATQTTIITALAGPKAAPRRPAAIVPTQTVPHLPAEQKRPFTEPDTPEQVIQVHIGRIEIRATPPETAPSPKKQRQLPVMGLDDYLRQRNGQGGKA